MGCRHARSIGVELTLADTDVDDGKHASPYAIRAGPTDDARRLGVLLRRSATVSDREDMAVSRQTYWLQKDTASAVAFANANVDWL